MTETQESERTWVSYIFPANLMFYLETCCDTFHEHFRSGRCRVKHSNYSSTTYIDCTLESTATASTNISNYFCALWPKRRIELFTNVVGISQSSPRSLFVSHFASCSSFPKETPELKIRLRFFFRSVANRSQVLTTHAQLFDSNACAAF